MKKIIVIASLFLFVSAIVFAGGSSEQTTETSSSNKNQTETESITEIVFLSSSVKPYDVAMPVMIEQFEKENPDIKVKLEMLPTKNIWEIIEIKLGAKEPTPDVLFTDSPLVTSYAVKEYLEPLDSYFSENEINQYLQVAIDAGSVNGKLYAAPFLNSSQVLYYNTDLFDEAGVPHLSKDPSKRLTWEEVAEIAKKVTFDRDNDGTPEVFGLGISQISRPYQMLSMPESLGGQAIGKDGLTVQGVLTDQAWLKASQFIQDIFNTSKVAPKGVSASDMLAYFPSGKLAMLIGPDYNVNAYNKLEGFNWDYAPYPYFKEGKAVTPTGSWCLGVNKASKNKDAAVRLIKFLTLSPNNTTWFEMDGHLPTNKQTLEYIATNEKYKTWPFDIFDLLNYESSFTAIPRPSTPAYLEYESVLTNAFEDIRNGSDIRTTLAESETRIERMLQKYR